MRILVICSHYPPEASPESSHALLLCENLSRLGGEVHLVTSPLLQGAPVPRGFYVHPEITCWTWRGARQIVRATRRIDPDVVLLLYVGWIYENHPMITFAPTFLRWAGLRISFVTQFENTLGPIVRTWREKIKWGMVAAAAGGRTIQFGSLLKKSEAVIALSDRHRDELVEAHPSCGSRISVIPAPPVLRMRSNDGGVARSEGRARLGLGHDDRTLVLAFFGYIYGGKGVETLLEAIAVIEARMGRNGAPQFKLLIIGRVGPDLVEKLRSMEQALSVASRIVWVGYQPEDVCSTYLWASDIAILPFDVGIRLNNSSFAVCAAHGLATVTTRGREIEPAFEHMKNVFLCPPRDATALSFAVEQLMLSPEIRAELGRGALRLAENLFSWDITARSTWSVLRRK